ncbi:hypothetical protein [Roseburia sp. 1XD42-34]|uniref:hypothetical protein n=2 Tax=Clostridia TaxID=186801 RepID=UPI000EA39410|nr:hypothetical protein [Roseburia sp. 1XD42-34]NBJ70171.1 hypothetical protein [Roseburia sp. 1XD42-34]RKI77128.1 hypothetical protein D7V87_11885 [Clostridium sp. 1xD42-85]
MDVESIYFQIYEMKEKLGKMEMEYWQLTSNIDTWYFWFNLFSFIVPLIILYKVIDRDKIFEVSFYGYSIHMISSKVNSALEANNLLVHPHSLTYVFPSGMTVTAVILPVAYMLVYQYCTNYNRNFYIFSFLLTILIAYGIDYVFVQIDYIRLHKGMNLTYLLVLNFVVACLSYWLTLLFKWMKVHTKQLKRNSS